MDRYSGSVAHCGEDVAEDLVADGDGVCAVDRVFGFDVGGGSAEALGEGEDGEQERFAEQAEGRVEGARDSCISGTGRGVTCGQSSCALGEVRVKMSAKLRALASRALSG